MPNDAPTSLPTAEQTLLLKAALRPDEVGRAAWEAWSRTVDLDDIDWGSHRLIPILVRNLKRLGVEHPDLGRMKGMHRYWWSHNQLRLRRLGDVLRVLGPTPVMLLKGIPLALRYYDDVGLRPMSDFDLLVPTAEAERSLSRLRGAGWTIQATFDPYRVDGRLDTAARPGVGLVDADGQECDLHWHLLHDCCWEGADDDFWERAEPLELAGGLTALAPAPTDLLLHVCVHGAAYNAMPTVRWVADAAAILGAAGDRVDWGRLVDLARRRLLVLPLKRALGYLEDEITIRLPAEARRHLDRVRVPLAERCEYARRIRDADYVHTVVGRWCQLSRRYPRYGFWGKITRAPGFMKEIWSVERTRQLPGAVVLRVLPAYLRKITSG
jgi:Uncharacterised nucleotidyltransferase